MLLEENSSDESPAALATQLSEEPGRSISRDNKSLRGDWLLVGLPPALPRHQNYYYWGPRGLYRRMHVGCELTFGYGTVDLESGHVSRCAYLSMARWFLGRVAPKIA